MKGTSSPRPSPPTYHRGYGTDRWLSGTSGYRSSSLSPAPRKGMSNEIKGSADMGLITVDRDTCTRCGLCATACPGGFLLFKKGGYPRPIAPVETYCLRCGHCVAVCASG